MQGILTSRNSGESHEKATQGKETQTGKTVKRRGPVQAADVDL